MPMQAYLLGLCGLCIICQIAVLKKLVPVVFIGRDIEIVDSAEFGGRLPLLGLGLTAAHWFESSQIPEQYGTVTVDDK
jgi:hypothetical protein